MPVCSFPIAKYYAILRCFSRFSPSLKCNLIPCPVPYFPDFSLFFLPDTPSPLSPSTNLFNTDNVFVVLAALVFLIYIDQNSLTKCLFWEFFNFPTVIKYVLSLTLFSPLEDSDSADPQIASRSHPFNP